MDVCNLIIIIFAILHVGGAMETVKVLEECVVSPPPGSVDEQTFALSFSDLMWINLHVLQPLYFFKFPHPKPYFLDTIIPSLKHSLSLALKHYYPFAGNILFPPNLKEPQFHYKDGHSSLRFIVAESDIDFDYITKHHQREVALLHPLLPQLPPPVWVQHGTTVAPVFAIQVTLFPNSGISIGLTANHCLADGNTVVRFMKCWAAIHKSQVEPVELDSAILPIYERSTFVKQTKMLATLCWEFKHSKMKLEGYRQSPPTSNVMATFVLRKADVQLLKKRVMVQRPTLSNVSTFTVACAYVWACIVKAKARCGEEMRENDLGFFNFFADGRAYLDPPLPENYFGNCVVPCIVVAKRKELKGKDGFISAVNIIGRTIRERLEGEKGVLVDLEKLVWHVQPDHYKEEGDSPGKNFQWGQRVSLAGSPRFAVYDIDFGLGKQQKNEVLSIDETRSVYLCEGKDNKHDIEISLSLPKIGMDAFASVFYDGLVESLSNKL